jgi:hypothetical protein
LPPSRPISASRPFGGEPPNAPFGDEPPNARKHIPVSVRRHGVRDREVANERPV